MASKTPKTFSVYEGLGQEMRRRDGHAVSDHSFVLGAKVRDLRMRKGLSGVELCRRAGNLDPKTLTAVEKGRIKNPSVKTLLSLARGLGVMVGDFFREIELEMGHSIHRGTQKGAFQVEFQKQGIKIVSFTPFIKDFFCGKIILSPKKKLTQTLLRHSSPLFVSSLIGRVELEVAEQKWDLREGDNLFFDGVLKHSLYNPLHRDAVLLIVTAPSFF